MNKIGAIIAIVVVLIVVVSGSLVLSGIIKLPSSSSSSSTTTSVNSNTLNSNVQEKAPNVVSSTVVNSSLGGQWTQKAGASGTASNLSSAGSITSFGMIGPSSTPYKADLSVAVRGITNPQFDIITPMTMSTQNFNPSNATIKQFEANLYEPSGNGFAALGYIQFTNSTVASYIYQYMNASAHSSYNYTSGTGQKIFLTNGVNYLYQWTQQAFGTNNILWNLSITVSLDNSYIIGIFYFTPDNLSQGHFTSLLNAEISKLSNPSSNVINNVFLTTAQVDTQTNMNFVQEVSVIVGISNGTQMFNEYANAYNLKQSISSPSEHLLINDTIGNLTLIGFSEYIAGEFNYSSTNGGMSGSMPILTMVGMANFTNTNIPYSIFLGIDSAATQNSQTSANTSTGTISYGNLGSGQYLYIHGPATTTTFYNGQSYQTESFGNASAIFSYDGSFVTVIFYVGHYALSKTAVLNLLSDEYSYL